MENMTLGRIADACGGTYYGKAEEKSLSVEAVTTDSRTAGKNRLFIPLKGEHADGHDFIPSAIEQGAFVLSERLLDRSCEPYIHVESTAQALKDLAEYYRRQTRIKVVGVVGSVGKTSTKEMIASVLSEKYRVLKTQGNFNNEIGLPLTVFQIRKEHEVAVLEMGISDFGEMHRLAKIARPDIIVMTNIGSCHLENLTDRDGVLKAKSEVFDFLKEDAVIVLNGDDDKLYTLKDVKGIRPLFFGMETPDAYAKATEVKDFGPEGVSAAMEIGEDKFRALISLPGLHNVWNALAGACIGKALGLSAEQIKSGIEHARTIKGRSNFIKTGGITVIDDCYNANPMSMKASLSVLSGMPGRKIAVLGDMGELGTKEKELHYQVGEYAAEAGIDALFLCGELSLEIKAAAAKDPRMEIYHYTDIEELGTAVKGYVKEGDTVLVKASHFMGFSKIVEALS
ncbi:MAG: UDP-N-acetylmuramoyl-tripeptide--D-alanyl-D-alanine ligase [Eubacterium sp.]|nr:UDP-N-acetylmuramoyl-tripeptide--D-alanyl-D-alanine ligase [Eubacterium sp.]